jgi:hypothetical protein
MQLTTGAWAASILATGARLGVFTALETQPDTAENLAARASISPRGAQALLDGLTGLGLLTLSSGRYSNAPDTSAFLVKGKPTYMGGFAEVLLDDFPTWQKLPQAMKTGAPSAANPTDVADNPFWHVLVPAIAALSFPVAQLAAERLHIAQAGSISWLDVGGGSGVVGGLARRQPPGHRLSVGLAKRQQNRARLRRKFRRGRSVPKYRR